MASLKNQKYHAFVKTVELGGLTRAAEVMGYTQSGISHMIQSLEDEVGVRLLYRDRSGVRMTTEGEQLLPYFVDICNSEYCLENKIRDILGLDAGIIRIGTINSVAVHWLPYIMKEFLADFPKVEFEMLYGDYTQIEKWVVEGSVDIGFSRLPSKIKLKSRFLKSDELVVIMPPDHPLSKQEVFPPEAFEIYPYAMIDEGEDYEMGAMFDYFHVKPLTRFTAKDDYTIVAMVANGLAISIMPTLVMKDMPYNVLMKPFPDSMQREIGVIYKDEKKLSVAAVRFLDYVLDWVERN